MNRRAGRPQGGPRGSTEQANALAEFLLALTAGSTVRGLAARYHVGKTLWGEYRAGLKIIPLELLNRLVRDHTPDEDTRRARLATAARLHAAATAAQRPAPAPAAVAEAAGDPPVAAVGGPPVAVGAGRRRSRPLLLAAGGTALTLLAALVLVLTWGPPREDAVFAVGPAGVGVFSWDGTDAAGWTRIGDEAERLYLGPAGVFATRSDGRLYRYEGEPGRWSLISEPGRDFAISGEHVFRLAADGGSVAAWDGEGTSWTTIGGPATRLYGGDPGLFATEPGTDFIYRYTGDPFTWQRIGTAGASFALTGDDLYGLTPDQARVNRWQPDDRTEPWPTWAYAAGGAAELWGGRAGLFSADPSRSRLRVLADAGNGVADQTWRDIGPAGAEVAVGRRAVYVLSGNRSRILRWSGGAWQDIGGPAQTLAAG
ncbi:hypothetical protein [Nonomuraea wenchangensis]|uniref:Uncharacterized protein n=1 Tax=Nonomuraea wenchangensis TaxID=568860 RepID=A0A1I0KEQ3_9ACTN|nr:hypothetical protein [Nonomuraea wenchangensis]SEU22004.1 hypothetical protein SAMN05421811_107441 [Nonomuraea wenchangensis]